jgi:hypothetical protein
LLLFWVCLSKWAMWVILKQSPLWYTLQRTSGNENWIYTVWMILFWTVTTQVEFNDWRTCGPSTRWFIIWNVLLRKVLLLDYLQLFILFICIPLTNVRTHFFLLSAFHFWLH